MLVKLTPEVGIYFHLRATLYFYPRLSGHFMAMSKLWKLTFADRMLPPPAVQISFSGFDYGLTEMFVFLAIK
jgi:hypothetical protein